MPAQDRDWDTVADEIKVAFPTVERSVFFEDDYNEICMLRDVANLRVVLPILRSAIASDGAVMSNIPIPSDSLDTEALKAAIVRTLDVCFLTKEAISLLETARLLCDLRSLLIKGDLESIRHMLTARVLGDDIVVFRGDDDKSSASEAKEAEAKARNGRSRGFTATQYALMANTKKVTMNEDGAAEVRSFETHLLYVDCVHVLEVKLATDAIIGEVGDLDVSSHTVAPLRAGIKDSTKVPHTDCEFGFWNVIIMDLKLTLRATCRSWSARAVCTDAR